MDQETNLDSQNISGSENPKPKSTKELVFIILIVAIIVAGVLFFKDSIKDSVLDSGSDEPNQTQNIQPDQLDIKYRSNTPSELPKEITEEMIFGDNVQIIQNYKYEDENEGIQNTVKYTTNSQSSIIHADYVNYFDQNKWQIDFDESTLDSFIIFAKQFPQDEQEQVFKEVMITGNSTDNNDRIITISVTTWPVRPIE